ncbi:MULTISPECIES: ribonuclease HII [Acidithrix]|uniref:Ribonuclease n=1 Tax=Acidithrix ferrooxidans TaxID=1280514 RepID=A0A0D8HKK7_9ACTN|nr:MULTISPECIES: ribonuclease HII [Acidithrix]KJF18394.1 ribonuclease HII [Acidithrix ferrooxidans]
MIDLTTGRYLDGLNDSDLVIGVDEVGRGSWAGPLSVGVVGISAGELRALLQGDPLIGLIDDSKVLSPSKREIANEAILEVFFGSVGSCSANECDLYGISRALSLATSRALESLGKRPKLILLDGRVDFVVSPGCRVVPLVKGDSRSLLIGAASIVAKVNRDRYMVVIDDQYPFWSFWRNKGYPSIQHRRSLRVYGLSAIHRVSWSYVATMKLQCDWSPLGTSREDHLLEG